MSERHIEREARVPQDPHDTGSRLTSIEAEQERQGELLSQIRDAVIGPANGEPPGLGEQVRDLRKQVRLLNWIVFALVGGAIASALNTITNAWALRLAGPPAPPTVIYVQASPPPHGTHP